MIVKYVSIRDQLVIRVCNRDQLRNQVFCKDKDKVIVQQERLSEIFILMRDCCFTYFIVYKIASWFQVC